MDLQALHTDQLQPVPLEQWFQRCKRKIKYVLMINGVELGVLDQLDAVGKFQDNTTIGFEERGEAGHEIVGVRRMSKDIIAKDEVSLLPLSRKLPRQVRTKEFDEGLNSLLARNHSDVGGRLDAQARNRSGLKISEQIP